MSIVACVVGLHVSFYKVVKSWKAGHSHKVFWVFCFHLKSNKQMKLNLVEWLTFIIKEFCLVLVLGPF